MAATQPRPDVSGEINTLLGKGSAFDGKLTFEGTVRIDGKLSGEVFSDDILIVGEGAEVSAEIEVGEIIIQGTVIGNIKAKRAVEIHAPGRVRGDITSPSLQIDKGVAFEGRSFMEGGFDKPKPAGGGGSKSSSGKSDSGSGKSDSGFGGPSGSVSGSGGMGGSDKKSDGLK